MRRAAFTVNHRSCKNSPDARFPQGRLIAGIQQYCTRAAHGCTAIYRARKLPLQGFQGPTTATIFLRLSCKCECVTTCGGQSTPADKNAWPWIGFDGELLNAFRWNGIVVLDRSAARRQRATGLGNP